MIVHALSHRLYTNTFLFRKVHEYLVLDIVSMVCKEVEAETTERWKHSEEFNDKKTSDIQLTLHLHHC